MPQEADPAAIRPVPGGAGVLPRGDASAHLWARETARHRHEVRRIASHRVGPFLERQKNDAADMEAVVEAALRPDMRVVEPRTSDLQARAVASRMRERPVKRRARSHARLRARAPDAIAQRRRAGLRRPRLGHGPIQPGPP